MKVTLQWQDDSFLPAHAEDVDYCAKLKQNSVFVVDVVRSRNPLYHRRAFACLHELFDMVETDLSFEAFRRLLTIKGGYFTDIGKVDIKGGVSVAVIPDSLAFEKMNEDDFHECFNNILQAFCDKFGKDLTLDQLTSWSRM